MNEHYVGDCLDVLPTFPEKYFDLVVADPPYAMPATLYEGRSPERAWSDSSILSGWWRGVMENVTRVLKEDGTVLVFTNPNAIVSFWPVMYREYRLSLAVWNKGRIGMGKPLRNMCEYVIVGTRGKYYVSDKGRGNIFNFKPVPPKEKAHVSEKPIGLIRELIRLFSPPGGRVLDPFAGSCVVRRGCDLETGGRECVTIEIDERYEQVADLI